MEKRKRRGLVMLSVLIAMVAAVYGWRFVGRANAGNGGAENAVVAKLVAADQGKTPQFPFFHPPAGGFRHMNWRKMTAAQRRAMHEKMRARFEAFLLEFAHASPAVQHQIVMQAKARFARMRKMRARWAHNRAKNAGAPGGAGGPGGRGGPHGHWKPGGLAANAPNFIAHSLVGGNPQFHAAATAFFMALHNQ